MSKTIQIRYHVYFTGKFRELEIINLYRYFFPTYSQILILCNIGYVVEKLGFGPVFKLYQAWLLVELSSSHPMIRGLYNKRKKLHSNC